VLPFPMPSGLADETNSELDGNATRVSRRRSRRRAELLSVAARQFAQFGYTETSLDSIADELGLTKASLYHYVESKEGLLCRIALEHVQRIISAATAASEVDGPPDERVFRLIVAHVEQVCIAPEGRLTPFYDRYLLHGEASGVGSLISQWRAEMNGYSGFVRQLVRDGVASKTFVISDVDFTVDMILGAANASGNWYLRRQSSITPTRLGAQLANLLVGGMLAPFRSESRPPGRTADRASH
jgi:AcrR family transcriptional regulator